MTPGQLVGMRMREARTLLGMSQSRLGRLLHDYLGREWAPQAVSVAERGGRQFDAAELLALSAVLEQPVAWFLTPGPEEQIEMPSGHVLGSKDLLGAAAREPALAGLIISEQVEQSLQLIRSAVRKLEKLRRTSGVLAASLTPSPGITGDLPSRDSEKRGEDK